jgi:organic hydroperoxide reductase OsmC/OhrA
MRIEAHVRHRGGQHAVDVATAGTSRAIAIPARAGAPGSSVNGGELLCSALATCYCNDIFREAAKRGIAVASVEVDVTAEFGGVGEPARSIRYSAAVAARASEADIRELMLHTDRVAEIQNTLRLGLPVMFESQRAESVA